MSKQALEKLVKMDANTQKTLLRYIKKLHHKGQGKAGAAFHEIPPTDFFPDELSCKRAKDEVEVDSGGQRAQVIQFTQDCITN